MSADKRKEQGIITFTICVLWMRGMSIKGVATLTGRTKGSIRGIIHRQFPVSREELSIETRQAELNRMKIERVDDGKLPDRYFTAAPLAVNQVAPKPASTVTVGPLWAYKKPKIEKIESSLPAPDPRTREGRKEIQRRRMEAKRKGLLDKEKQSQREMGGATNRGIQGAALEYLHEMGLLADDRRVDAAREVGIAAKERRKEAGRILRGYIDGCRIGGLSGIDLDKVGSGSNSKLAISAYRLQAIHAVGAIRNMMQDRDYSLIEAVVDRDEFVWEQIPSGNARGFIYEAIRRALDTIAVFEELMGLQAFEVRWGYQPKIDNKGMDRDEARRVSNRAEEVLRSAR